MCDFLILELKGTVSALWPSAAVACQESASTHSRQNSQNDKRFRNEKLPLRKRDAVKHIINVLFSDWNVMPK